MLPNMPVIFSISLIVLPLHRLHNAYNDSQCNTVAKGHKLGAAPLATVKTSADPTLVATLHYYTIGRK